MSGWSKTIAAFNSSAFSSNTITLYAQRTHPIFIVSSFINLRNPTRIRNSSPIICTPGSSLSWLWLSKCSILFIKKNSPAPLCYQSFLQTTRFSLSPLFNLLYCGPRVWGEGDVGLSWILREIKRWGVLFTSHFVQPHYFTLSIDNLHSFLEFCAFVVSI